MVPANAMERDWGLEEFTINFSTYEGLNQLLAIMRRKWGFSNAPCACDKVDILLCYKNYLFCNYCNTYVLMLLHESNQTSHNTT